jgi:hypothetical protein
VRRAALHFFAVQSRDDADFRVIGDLVTRHEPRSEGGRCIEVFAGCPLRCMLLPLAYRTIVVSGITGDNRPGIRFSNPAAAAAAAASGYDRQLSFVIWRS